MVLLVIYKYSFFIYWLRICIIILNRSVFINAELHNGNNNEINHVLHYSTLLLRYKIIDLTSYVSYLPT